MSFLTLAGVQAGYGAMEVLHGLDLSLAEGETLALLGRNGMGKTTTIRAICGMIPATGHITLAGRSLVGLPPHQIAQAGIGLVPEGRRVFAPLNVRENLIAAARPGPWDLAKVIALFPRLGERLGQRAGTLSGGEQQMLAIGRALMTAPRLLLLDEATEGLAPVVRAEIWAALKALKADGLATLVIDKSLTELRAIADHAAILVRGQSLWSGPFDTLDKAVIDRHLTV